MGFHADDIRLSVTRVRLADEPTVALRLQLARDPIS